MLRLPARSTLAWHMYRRRPLVTGDVGETSDAAAYFKQALRSNIISALYESMRATTAVVAVYIGFERKDFRSEELWCCSLQVKMRERTCKMWPREENTPSLSHAAFQQPNTERCGLARCPYPPNALADTGAQNEGLANFGCGGFISTRVTTPYTSIVPVTHTLTTPPTQPT